METKFGFTLMKPAEFGPWLKQQQVSRAVSVIQIHHTWLPNYSNFNGSNHFEKLQGMKASHLARGFSDIAQNLTIFPDGKIAVCRPLNVVPAGIYGQNSKGICIENLGDFDSGRDQMTAEHKDAILQASAHLCNKFGLLPDTNSIVYHHWFDLKTGQRTNGSGNTKSCPGTAFFGGNTVSAAQQNFIPMVSSILDSIRRSVQPPPTPLYYGVVTSTSNLNIRKGAGVEFDKIGSLPPGASIQVYAENSGWLKINVGNQWVSARYVAPVKHGVVHVDSAGVYAGPGGTYNLLNTLSNGDTVTVYDTVNGWSRIDFIDKWVKAQLITIKE